MENQDENAHNQNTFGSDLTDTKKTRANVESRNVNSLNIASREERKREAGKPLYLTRYE